MKNHFKKFSLPQTFHLNLTTLEQTYFALQKLSHPDASSLAKVEEIENSIAINEAYEILRNPLKRAAHILQLNNIDVEKDGDALRPDLATLEEVLEIQEQIPNLNAEEILALKKTLQTTTKSILENIAEKLDSKDFTSAAQLLIKAKYFDKILRGLKESNK